MQTCAAVMENSMEFPQQLKIERPYDSKIPSLCIFLKHDIKILKGYALQYLLQHYSQWSRYKRSKHQSIGDWIKVWCIYTYGMLSSNGKKRILPVVIT